MKHVESSEAGALGCLSAILTLVFAPPWRAWCLIRIYDWHLRPIFGGPNMGILQVWALLVFLGLLITQLPQDVEEKKTTFLERSLRLFMFGFVYPALALFVAWILTVIG